MAELTKQQATRAGTVLTYGNADVAGDAFENDGTQAVIIVNGGGTPVVVTIETPATVDDLAVADRTVTIAQGATKIIGPFTRSVYNDGDGKVQITYDGVDGVEIAVIDI